MRRLKRSVLRRVTATMVRRYQHSDGRKAGSARGVPVLLLTVPGRRTGAPHTVPVCFIEREGEWVVTASAGGARDDPQWFRNLRATDRAEVQVGAERVPVAVSIPDPAARDQAWAQVLARAPFFATYERKAGRTIPVAVLRPLAA